MREKVTGKLRDIFNTTLSLNHLAKEFGVVLYEEMSSRKDVPESVYTDTLLELKLFMRELTVLVLMIKGSVNVLYQDSNILRKIKAFKFLSTIYDYILRDIPFSIEDREIIVKTNFGVIAFHLSFSTESGTLWYRIRKKLQKYKLEKSLSFLDEMEDMLNKLKKEILDLLDNVLQDRLQGNLKEEG